MYDETTVGLLTMSEKYHIDARWLAKQPGPSVNILLDQPIDFFAHNETNTRYQFQWSRLTEIRVRIVKQIHFGDVITHSYSNFNGGFSKQIEFSWYPIVSCGWSCVVMHNGFTHWRLFRIEAQYYGRGSHRICLSWFYIVHFEIMW